mmetsp:Transcript_38155/g.115351  ORF Transcript_38155/g.115351 Transcript_38155/m.115351 type:complete len:219 (-) Transcript_38155:557-1213(-)
MAREKDAPDYLHDGQGDQDLLNPVTPKTLFDVINDPAYLEHAHQAEHAQTPQDLETARVARHRKHEDVQQNERHVKQQPPPYITPGNFHPVQHQGPFAEIARVEVHRDVEQPIHDKPHRYGDGLAQLKGNLQWYQDDILQQKSGPDKIPDEAQAVSGSNDEARVLNAVVQQHVRQADRMQAGLCRYRLPLDEQGDFVVVLRLDLVGQIQIVPTTAQLE